MRRDKLRVAFLWIAAAIIGGGFAHAGDHTDIERRAKPTLQSLPGPMPVSKLEPSAANQCLCGPAMAGPNAPPTYRPINANDLPPGLPPGPHAMTHESGGTDQLSVNAPTAPNRVYASPASGGAGPPVYRPLVEADLPVAPLNQVLAGPTSGGAAPPVYRPLQPADLAQAPANQILAGPTSGGMGPVTYRPLAAADVAGVAASSTHASTHLPAGSDPLATAAPVTVTGTSNTAGTAASFARSDHQHALSYAAPVTVTGTSNSAGASNSVSRADHQHALGTHASTHLPSGADALTTAAPSSGGTANSAGTANSFARSDHVHDAGNGHLASKAAVFNYIALPATAGGALVTPLAANSGTNTFSGVVNPDVCRGITYSTQAGWDGGALTWQGTDCDGQAISYNTGVLSGATSAVTLFPFKTITNVQKSNVGASAATASLVTATYLGLTGLWGKRINSNDCIITINAVLGNAGAIVSNPAQGAQVSPSTTPNGARNYVIVCGIL